MSVGGTQKGESKQRDGVGWRESGEGEGDREE